MQAYRVVPGLLLFVLVVVPIGGSYFGYPTYKLFMIVVVVGMLCVCISDVKVFECYGRLCRWLRRKRYDS